MECIFFYQCEFVSLYAKTDGDLLKEFNTYTKHHCNGPLRSTCVRRRAIFANQTIEPRLAPDGAILPAPVEPPPEEDAEEEVITAA